MFDHEGDQDDDIGIIQSESARRPFLLSSSLLGLVCEDKGKVGTRIFFTVALQCGCGCW